MKQLLVYGGGSIKRNGLYDQIVGLLKDRDLELFELSGVEPNPRHTTVNRGAAICREEKIDVILAAGGGSTIDCAKGIADAALTENGDVWPLVSGGVWVQKALPVAAILTNAATGSEMDAWEVISNMDTNEKIGLGGIKVFHVPEGMEAMEGAKQAIRAVSKFCCETLGLQPALSDLQIDSTHFEDMAQHACMGGVITGPMELRPNDVLKIYEMCL